MKNTKIVCTLGPASEDLPVLKKMIKAGMNCARLNFSHGSYENFHKIITNVKKAAEEMNTQVALIQDLQGPKIRVGKLPEEGVKIKKGQKIILTTSSLQPTTYNLQPFFIPIQYKRLPRDVHKNDTILIDDGLIELKVVSTDKKARIVCKVINSGIIKSHKGINVPGGEITAPAITSKDLKDIKFGLKYDLDYVALSFVKSEKDIIQLRKILTRYKSKAKIIAKIERREAVDNLKKIIKEVDAIMIARGDLGLEIDAEKVPIVQKEIVRLGNIYAKPTIIATQMLQSMVDNPRATRAEVSDAATAVFDHADAFMLSNETSVGKYPIEAVTTLSKVAKAVEMELKSKRYLLPNLKKEQTLSVIDVTCLNACDMAYEVKAKYLVVITGFGTTARFISKYRIYTPIITFTDQKRVKNQLSLVWGIKQVDLLASDHFPPREDEIGQILKKKNMVKKGEKIVIVNVRKGRYLISTRTI